MTVEVQSNGTHIADPLAAPKEEPVEAVDDLTELVKVETVAAAAEPNNADHREPEDDKEHTTLGSIMEKSSSFKEESYFLTDLKDHEKKALMDLKSMLEDAVANNDKLYDTEEEEENMKEGTRERGISLWGVTLVPTTKSPESANVLLLKFLRAREFKEREAFDMIRNTLRWRKECKVDSILEESSLGAGPCKSGACFVAGRDREGRPVCYNVFGAFGDAESYRKAFGTEERRKELLRWRVRVMEEGIRELEFRPGAAASFVQVIDLKNSPGVSKKELRIATREAVQLLQDNYPEFVAKNIFINVPFWFYAFSALISPFLTLRTRSKFVFARPWRVTETLLKYIPAENIPVSYGGLKREGDVEFSGGDDVAITELVVKAGSTENVEIPLPQAETTLVWDLTVLGWEVNYKEEFVPFDEGSYTIVIQKPKKIGYQEETIRNSYKNSEPGKVVLAIENSSYKKKRVLFRCKANNC
ncbi:patellin-4-like [Ananas comosus]|uniref:Patellin-4-like n=1 Tax=Ananas comosus TaxID=4615 RepID=A0A6P5FBU0_ANACO|nr:patellin-4-like [Ananas comosus]